MNLIENATGAYQQTLQPPAPPPGIAASLGLKINNPETAERLEHGAAMIAQQSRAQGLQEGQAQQADARTAMRTAYKQSFFAGGK